MFKKNPTPKTYTIIMISIIAVPLALNVFTSQLNVKQVKRNNKSVMSRIENNIKLMDSLKSKATQQATVQDLLDVLEAHSTLVNIQLSRIERNIENTRNIMPPYDIYTMLLMLVIGGITLNNYTNINKLHENYKSTST